MGSRSISYKIVMSVFAASLISTAAYAEQKPLEPFILNAKYTVSWNGITLGRIRLHGTEDATSYKLSVDTKTKGIAAMFSSEKRIATAEGKRHSDGSYRTVKYESMPMDSDEGRRTTLIYDENGKLGSMTRMPAEDPNWRPEVSKKEVNQAVDSTTAGLVLRRELYSELQKGKGDVSTKAYDGARLATMRMQALKQEARVQIMGNYVPAINTLVTRQPINGYTPKEMKKFNAGDPEIHLYFSADAKFIPLLATVDTSFGKLSATLDEVE